MTDAANKPKQMTAYDKFQIMSDEEYILCDDAYDSVRMKKLFMKIHFRISNIASYCSTKLIKIENETLEESRHRDYCLWYCDKCCFWQARIYSAFRACMPPPDYWAYVSKLREFNPNLPEAVVQNWLCTYDGTQICCILSTQRVLRNSWRMSSVPIIQMLRLFMWEVPATVELMSC